MPRLVFIGPAVVDDPVVNEFMVKRVDRIKENPKDFIEGEIEDLELACLMPGFTGALESEKLDGTWASIREFHDVRLPALRANIKRQCSGNNVLVHVDLGESLITLYAAYFAIKEAKGVSVTFHLSDNGGRFTLGGSSPFAQYRPMLRRFLGYAVLRGAETVFVSDPKLTGVLSHVFPQSSGLELLLDPFSPVPDPVPESDLPSEGGG